MVIARASLKTALWCWLTKMMFQWVVVGLPLLLFFCYTCEYVVPLLFTKLLIDTSVIATIFTGIMLFGQLKLDETGIYYTNPCLFQKRFIAWDDVCFGRALPILLERPYVLKSQQGRTYINIWPSMRNYVEVEQYFAQHQISLKTGARALPKKDFRPFEEVIKDALSS